MKLHEVVLNQTLRSWTGRNVISTNRGGHLWCREFGDDLIGPIQQEPALNVRMRKVASCAATSPADAIIKWMPGSLLLLTLVGQDCFAGVFKSHRTLNDSFNGLPGSIFRSLET